MKGAELPQKTIFPLSLKGERVKGVRLRMMEIYVGATQKRSTNIGGWGVVLVDEDGRWGKHNDNEERRNSYG